MSTLVYNLQDIQEITQTPNDFKLSEDTSKNINSLIALLGIDVNAYKQRINKKDRIVKDNQGKWPKKEVFKTTVIEKKEGLDEKLDQLRGLMNKLSASNYETKKEDILECVQAILDNTQEDFNIVLGKFIDRFNSVVQNNRFYADLYARLFTFLSDKYIVIAEYHEYFINKYTDTLSEFVYCDPDKDYDRFCEINQLNERRKASICFIIHLIKEDIYSFSTITDILTTLFAKIDDNKLEKSELELNEEVIENISVIMTESKDLVLREVSKYSLIEKITGYSILKSGENPGFSSRMRFKCMGLVELYQK
jgi:hypothetical protein